jgi:putative FmdB family regulatory protein
MPIYEYEVDGGHCAICKGRFELMRPLSAPPLTNCPVCRKPVHKLVSRVSAPDVAKGFSASDAKAAGFTVLKRRDKGVYEKE